MSLESTRKDLYRIIVADHHPLVREGVKKILMSNHELKILGEAADRFELHGLLHNTSPDMVILEISKKFGGTGTISEIKNIQPLVKVLVLTIHKEKKLIHDAFHAGADGYMLKKDPVDILLSAIESLRKDGTFISAEVLEASKEDWVQTLRRSTTRPSSAALTQRQTQILNLIAKGKTSKEIAGLLSISVHTVRRHRALIREKLTLKRNTDLVRAAVFMESP